MTDFAWALIGPGSIAHRFADAVHQLPGTHLRCVLGRDGARAAAFAQHWARDGQPGPAVLADIGALLGDERVDGVYIATPHASHAGFIRQCLQAGKPVLCEKPLVTSLGLAQELTALAQTRGVFLMEALWSRFLPAYAQAGAWLRAGAIGQLQGMQSSFCFPAPYDPNSRLFNPALAGGGLLDLGIYNLAMSRWAVEAATGAPCPAPLGIQAQGTLAPTGVDQRVAGTITFPGGITSQFVCALDGAADNGLHLFGSAGSISLPSPFWGATEAVLRQPDGSAQTVAAPYRINGFEGEIEEAMRCIRAGLVESPRMPHAESLMLISGLDEMRRQVGVRYPFEIRT
jgi:predicted dehydrogenase